MVLYTLQVFHLTLLSILNDINATSGPSGVILIAGTNLKLPRELGDAKFDLGSTKNYCGSIKKIIQAVGPN